MNILFVVPYNPSPIRVRSLYLIKSLLKLGHQVTLLYLIEKEYASKTLPKTTSLKPVGFKLPGWKSMLNCITALPGKQPLQAVYSWSRDLSNHLLSILSQQTIDVVHVEHLRGAKYALLAKKHPNIPVIWDSVDSITYLFKQTQKNHPQKLIRWLLRFELQRTEKYERFLSTQFDKVLVTSSKDRDEYLRLSPSSPIEVITNGVDIDYFSPPPEQARHRNVLLISGKMSYHANVDMALFTINQILPLVWQTNPELELWIVGKDPPPALQQFTANPKITITGTVPEILPYLQKATIALAPLNYGAGVQNKVLEAMACGTPVIASPLAVSALNVIDGVHVLIAKNPQHYAELISKMISNPLTADQIGKSGREYVEKEHSWDQVGLKLETIYRKSIEAKL
ncbi:MAG: glycosyltransferase [Chloroflexota bacterium]|nr:MAG: glycosyl transferase family 1 [Bellilinea sp.]